MDSGSDQEAEGKAVVTVLAAVLERLVESNSVLPNDQEVTKFHALKAPGISVRQYLERVSSRFVDLIVECSQASHFKVPNSDRFDFSELCFQ
jgi:hypothetical protein